MGLTISISNTISSGSSETDFIISESRDFITTESGDFLTIE
jgi:hypothetical protein